MGKNTDHFVVLPYTDIQWFVGGLLERKMYSSNVTCLVLWCPFNVFHYWVCCVYFKTWNMSRASWRCHETITAKHERYLLELAHYRDIIAVMVKSYTLPPHHVIHTVLYFALFVNMKYIAKHDIGHKTGRKKLCSLILVAFPWNQLVSPILLLCHAICMPIFCLSSVLYHPFSQGQCSASIYSLVVAQPCMCACRLS